MRSLRKLRELCLLQQLLRAAALPLPPAPLHRSPLPPTPLLRAHPYLPLLVLPRSQCHHSSLLSAGVGLGIVLCVLGLLRCLENRGGVFSLLFGVLPLIPEVLLAC